MQENNPTTLYLSLEKTIKTTARLMALDWGVNASDLLSVANESFMRALNTFDPSKECALKTWCISVIKSNLRDECRKQKLSKSRFYSIGDYKVETFNEISLDDQTCLYSREIERQIDLQSELRKFSKSAQQYALTRMKGYNAHEIAKFRMMSRRDILKAKKEIESCHK